MNNNLLRKISQQQTERFFYSYSPDWRLIQITSIEKLLNDRFDFYKDIIENIKLPNSLSSDATIAQEVTNGLFFEAIAIAIQAAEDLFAIVNASQKPLKFISHVITYSAGKIDNLLKKKFTKEEIATTFYFPLFNERYETIEQNEKFDNSLNFLFQLVMDIQQFYKDYRFFYNQYKHGLSVAFRPFGDYSPEQVAKRKSEPLYSYLNVFDNVSVSKLESDSARFNKMMFMPYLTPEIMSNLPQLIKDDNLLRFVRPISDISIELCKSIVIKSRICVAAIGNNLVNSLKNEFPISLQLPYDLKNTAYKFNFPEDVYKSAINKKIFIN